MGAPFARPRRRRPPRGCPLPRCRFAARAIITVFTICASVEIAGCLRGGRGLFGWLATLPWNNPVMLASAFSFVMLGFGGAGGLINMN